MAWKRRGVRFSISPHNFFVIAKIYLEFTKNIVKDKTEKVKY